jgi:hypothetical protein
MWRNGVAAIEEDFIVVVGEGLSTAGDGYGEGLSTVEDGDGGGLSTVEDGDGEGLIIAHPDSGLATTKERAPKRLGAEAPAIVTSASELQYECSSRLHMM